MTTTEPTIACAVSPELRQMSAGLIKEALRLQMDARSLTDRVAAFERYRTALFPDGGLPVDEANRLLEESSNFLGLTLLWDLIGAVGEDVGELLGSHPSENQLDSSGIWKLFRGASEALKRLEGDR